MMSGLSADYEVAGRSKEQISPCVLRENPKASLERADERR